MKILCHDHYDEAVKFAASIGNYTLQKCLERLQAWETNPNKKCEIELCKDAAPYSFFFTQRFEDGTVGIEGGVIYHGKPDESLSYLMVPSEGWHLHT